MIITRWYIKNFLGVVAILTTIAVFIIENYFDMVDNYCTQGNEILGLFINQFGIHACSWIVIAGEALSFWFGMFLFVVCLDLITRPIRAIIKRRKNRVWTMKNTFFD